VPLSTLTVKVRAEIWFEIYAPPALLFFW